MTSDRQVLEYDYYVFYAYKTDRNDITGTMLRVILSTCILLFLNQIIMLCDEIQRKIPFDITFSGQYKTYLIKILNDNTYEKRGRHMKHPFSGRRISCFMLDDQNKNIVKFIKHAIYYNHLYKKTCRAINIKKRRYLA